MGFGELIRHERRLLLEALDLARRQFVAEAAHLLLDEAVVERDRDGAGHWLEKRALRFGVGGERGRHEKERAAHALAGDQRQHAERLHALLLHEPGGFRKRRPHFHQRPRDVPLTMLHHPMRGASLARPGPRRDAFPMQLTPGQNVALQRAAIARQHDAEAVGLDRGPQAIGERAEEHVALEMMPDRAGDLEQRLGFEVGAPQLRVRFRQLLIGALPLEFRAAPRREDFQRRDVVVGRLQRRGMQHGEVPERAALRVPHRHADVAVRAHLLQPEVIGILRPQSRGRRADMAGGHALAWCAGKLIREAGAEIRAVPEGQRARFEVAQRLRGEGIARPERLRGAPRERAKKLVARRGRRPFRDDAQHGSGASFGGWDARGHWQERALPSSNAA